MNILLIEDEGLLRRSLAFFLRSNGYEVTEFDNGTDAIKHIRANHAHINLVITDLHLPSAGGRHVLHATNPYKNIQKIVLTSESLESTEAEVFELGSDDFIAKPFSPSVLLKRIEKLLHES